MLILTTDHLRRRIYNGAAQSLLFDRLRVPHPRSVIVFAARVGNHNLNRTVGGSSGLQATECRLATKVALVTGLSFFAADSLTHRLLVSNRVAILKRAPLRRARQVHWADVANLVSNTYRSKNPDLGTQILVWGNGHPPYFSRVIHNGVNEAPFFLASMK